MEGLSAKGIQCITGFWPQPAGFGLKSATVCHIAHNRVPDMGEMHPDLMGAPCFQSTGDKACNRPAVGPEKTFEDLPVSDRPAPTRAYSLLVAGMGMTPKRGLDCALRTIRCTPDNSEIAALDRPFGFLRELP